MGGRVGERAGTASEIALPRFPKQTSKNRPAVASRDRAEHGDQPERQQHDVHAVEPGEGGIGIARHPAREAAMEDQRLADEQQEGEDRPRSEEHTSELQSLMRISYAVFCLKKKTIKTKRRRNNIEKKHT